MSVQDDSREKEQIKIFGLEEFSKTNRGSEHWPDASLKISDVEYFIELKSKPKYHYPKGKKSNKTSFSTARGFGPHKVEEWDSKTHFFVIGEHEEGVFDEQYAITFQALYSEIEKKVLKPYKEGRKPRKNSDGYYGVKPFHDIIVPVVEEHLTANELKQFIHTFENGARLNDPKFSWAYIKKHGTMVKNKNDLIKFVKDNNIKGGAIGQSN